MIPTGLFLILAAFSTALFLFACWQHARLDAVRRDVRNWRKAATLTRAEALNTKRVFDDVYSGRQGGPKWRPMTEAVARCADVAQTSVDCAMSGLEPTLTARPVE